MFRSRSGFRRVERADPGFHVRMHDLRHAHAAWLLAGEADLKTVTDRRGTASSRPFRSTCTRAPAAEDTEIAALD